MRGAWKKAAFACALESAPLIFATTARADSPVPAAQALFDDAKGLMSEGRYAEACPMLQESERLAPGIGTKFNLADCHEHEGRTATAWAEFIAAASAARMRGQTDREEVARARAKALDSHLARLVIVVPPEMRSAGLEVQRDGEIVGKSQWDREIPVDPGPHAVAARDGIRAWHTSIAIAPEATTRVTIGVLAETPNARPARPEDTRHEASPAQASSTPSTRTILAISLGAMGVAGLAIGTAFGLQSISKYDDSQPFCRANGCSATGLSLRDDSIRAGNVATIAVIAGAVALVAGGIVWLTAPSSKPAHAPTKAE